MRSNLNKIIEAYRQSSELTIIVGIDANHHIRDFDLSFKVNIAPLNPEESTSIKKRSYIQAQLHKADLLVDELKDHIITSLVIETYNIELINKQKNQR